MKTLSKKGVKKHQDASLYVELSDNIFVSSLTFAISPKDRN